MRVAILTMFNGLHSTYSLVNVVESHVEMLLNHGVEVKMLVSEHCPDHQRHCVFLDERLEWVKIKNSIDGKVIRWHDYTGSTGTLHDSFETEVNLFASEFEKHLKGCDVCMMHDILYQGWHYVHNIAVRKAQKALPGVRFVAFTHSLPVEPPEVIEEKFSGRYTPMPNTLFVYPTQSGLPALAKQYGVGLECCRTVYNVNPIFEYLCPEIKALHQKTDLLGPEILIIYPARLTTGKQHEKVAMLAGCIARCAQKKTKIIFCDFESMDTGSSQYKKLVTGEGVKYGLSPEDIVFTSDNGFKEGFPRQGVLDLFTLSNLFICPSYSESFGLTVLEAASRGNFIVLNQAVPALEELGTLIHAHFMRWNARNFGFDTIEHYHPSELDYCMDHARIIVNQMDQNTVIHAKTLARTRYQSDWIWENQMRPLLTTEIETNSALEHL